MKRQVIIIHGGETYDSYEEYVSALKKYQVDWSRIFSTGWKGSLPKELGDTFEVLSPRMPNSLNAKYVEWKIWFEKLVPFFNEEVILVGHSLGGIFLAKYLSENEFLKKIIAIFIIAAPSISRSPNESLADFILPVDMSRLEKYGDKIYIYYSTDDKGIHQDEFQLYVNALPRANLRVFNDKGHFTNESFPELVEDIKKLSQ